jgi:hypothetical protein
MGQPWFGVVPACNRFWFSSAPSGLVIVPCFFTHGLRRGLHSFAASRLESSGFGIVFGGLVVAAGLDCQAGVGLQQVPGFAVGAVFLALAGGGEVEAAVFSSYYVEGDYVPVVDGNEQDGEEVYCAGLILFALRSHYVEAVTVSAALVDGGLYLDSENSALVGVDITLADITFADVALYPYVVSAGIAEGLGDFHAQSGGHHHEIEFGPFASFFAVFQLGSC